MKPTRLLPEAQDEYEASFGWYLRRSVRAALGFDAAFAAALLKIRRTPKSWPKLPGDRRYCILDRYPFRLVYRETHEEILILAVAHAKRRATYWRRRS